MGRTPLSMESYLGKPISPRIIQAVYKDIPLIRRDGLPDWSSNLEHVQDPLDQPSFSCETVFGLKTYLEINEGVSLIERGLWQCNLQAEFYSEDRIAPRLAVTDGHGRLFLKHDAFYPGTIKGRTRISRDFFVQNYEAPVVLILHVTNAHGVASAHDMKLTVRLIGSEDA